MSHNDIYTDLGPRRCMSKSIIMVCVTHSDCSAKSFFTLLVNSQCFSHLIYRAGMDFSWLVHFEQKLGLTFLLGAAYHVSVVAKWWSVSG